MKKLILLAIIVLNSNFGTSQHIKTDTLVGKNGIIKRFTPKEISIGQKLSFNLKLIYSLKNKSGKEQVVSAYLNTKYGYIGILPSVNGEIPFNPNAKNFQLIVYSNSKQNFMFNSSKKGKKTVMSMPIMPKNEFKFDDVTIKKENSASRKCTNLNIDAYAYNNSKSSANEKVIMYLSDATLSGKVKYQNQLSYAGIGFYQINGKTVLNMSIESNGTKITLDKIEKVNVVLNSADFKKEDSGVSNEMIQAIMKNVKKQ